MVKNSIILLTACIDPCGMKFTELQDIKVRLSNYQQALDYYLQCTPYRIVVVENSLNDFSTNYQTYLKSGRLEYITFDGNSFNKDLGKGYGEGQIIRYAFEHSSFVRESEYIIKISGRYIISNMFWLIKSTEFLWNKKSSFVASNLSLSRSVAPSEFFIAHKEFFINYLLKNIYKINDSMGLNFEHVFFESIIDWIKQKRKFYMFLQPVVKEGISGTFGNKIKKDSFLVRLYYLFISLLVNTKNELVLHAKTRPLKIIIWRF